MIKGQYHFNDRDSIEPDREVGSKALEMVVEYQHEEVLDFIRRDWLKGFEAQLNMPIEIRDLLHDDDENESEPSHWGVQSSLPLGEGSPESRPLSSEIFSQDVMDEEVSGWISHDFNNERTPYFREGSAEDKVDLSLTGIPKPIVFSSDYSIQFLSKAEEEELSFASACTPLVLNSSYSCLESSRATTPCEDLGLAILCDQFVNRKRYNILSKWCSLVWDPPYPSLESILVRRYFVRWRDQALVKVKKSSSLGFPKHHKPFSPPMRNRLPTLNDWDGSKAESKFKREHSNSAHLGQDPTMSHSAGSRKDAVFSRSDKEFSSDNPFLSPMMSYQISLHESGAQNSMRHGDLLEKVSRSLQGPRSNTPGSSNESLSLFQSLSFSTIQAINHLTRLQEDYTSQSKARAIKGVFRIWSEATARSQAQNDLAGDKWNSHLERFAWSKWSAAVSQSIENRIELSLLCTSTLGYLPLKNWYTSAIQIKRTYPQLSKRLISRSENPSPREGQLAARAFDQFIACADRQELLHDKAFDFCLRRFGRSAWNVWKGKLGRKVFLIEAIDPQEESMSTLAKEYRSEWLLARSFSCWKARFGWYQAVDSGLCEVVPSKESHHYQISSQLASFVHRREEALKSKVIMGVLVINDYKKKLEVARASVKERIKLEVWRFWLKRSQVKTMTSKYKNVILANHPQEPAGEIAQIILNSRFQVAQTRAHRRKFQMWRLLSAQTNFLGEKAAAYRKLQVLKLAFSKWYTRSKQQSLAREMEEAGRMADSHTINWAFLSWLRYARTLRLSRQ